MLKVQKMARSLMKDTSGIQKSYHNKNCQNQIDTNCQTNFIEAATGLLISLFHYPVSQTIIYPEMLNIIFVCFFLFGFY